tara:strand:- start:34840 stop:35859 length:1020 start_codon:yes stop_codon:yes gene_type:complete
MPERLIQILVPEEDRAEIEDFACEHGLCVLGGPADQPLHAIELLVQANEVEGVIDAATPILKRTEHARLVVLAVEASYPRIEKEEEKDNNGDADEDGSKSKKSPARISRDELYADVNEFAEISWTFVIMTVLSSIVAAVGFSRNSPAVIIGAMVIAPLLGPNMALALATTLGDTKLAFRSLRTNAIGVSIAIVTGAVSGLIWPLDTASNEIALRTNSSFGEIALALVTGIAGALAVSTGVASSLVGVMVAVALLPPIIIASMLAVQGSIGHAGDALLLLAINVICLNLASVLTFRAKGIRPSSWWEAERAKKSTRIAMIGWFALLGMVIGLVWYTKLLG